MYAGLRTKSNPRPIISSTGWPVGATHDSLERSCASSARHTVTAATRIVVAIVSATAHRGIILMDAIFQPFLLVSSRIATLGSECAVPLEQFIDFKTNCLPLPFGHLIEGDVTVVKPLINLLDRDTERVGGVRHAQKSLASAVLLAPQPNPSLY